MMPSNTIEAGNSTRRLSKKHRFPFIGSNRGRSPGAESTFSASQILPSRQEQEQPNLAAAFIPPPDLPTMLSTRGNSISPVPASIFSIPQVEEHDYQTEQTTVPNSGSGDEREQYDLKPPPPSTSFSNMEALAMRLFSSDHLDVILRDYQLSTDFKRFLKHYKPHAIPSLESYVDMQKVVAAIEYANAVADNVPLLGEYDIHHPAAVVDKNFQERSQRVVRELVDDALPTYIAHRLVQISTDILVKEITGTNVPVIRDMIPSLAEVYCVTDPSTRDNPIVYASEGFYETTQYGKEHVIGRNCRFLQGPKSSSSTVDRLIEAIRIGQEITEIILNYRRDGTPFMNLLMIAPLYDNKGSVRYFLGCQIDVSHLITDGKGLESFSTLLANDRISDRYAGLNMRKPATVLGELGQMMNNEELDAVNKHARSQSRDSSMRARPGTPAASARRPQSSRGPTRRILGMEDTAERNMWPHPSLGPSGRLPGVYQNYLLVRPYPSLRITFTSPALRIPGLLQTKLLDRIGGPQSIRDNLTDSLAHGIPVTAKISWLSSNDPIRGTGVEGKPRWLHCTPLLGSDDKVGVWMIVMVESEVVTGQLRRPSEVVGANQINGSQYTIGSGGAGGVSGGAASGSYTIGGGALGSTGPNSPNSPRITQNANKLYAEYLRREGRSEEIEEGVVSRGGSSRGRGTAPIEPQPFGDL